MDKMCRYVVIAAFVLVVGKLRSVAAPPPMRLTIDCSGDDDKNAPSLGTSLLRSATSTLFGTDNFDVDSFCRLIHKAIPKAVKDGKFILVEPMGPAADTDQSAHGDTQFPVLAAPPQGFAIPRMNIPKFKLPRLKIPRLNVPRLMPAVRTPFGPPRIGNAVVPSFRESAAEDSSAERMERFKKGVQKMLHVVKVLGQVDHYLTERTRIVVDKLSKTFAD